ncbi:MAG: hypothetical protein EA422_10020 [Gemmatimonadales bacterium]|nr:MAG: hypothetical protein EA422_10020 [Gemmatimonadales bacterium]
MAVMNLFPSPWAGFRLPLMAALFALVLGPTAAILGDGGGHGLVAQEILSPRPGASVTGGTGIVFQSFSFEEEARTGFETISLLTVPLGARANLGSRARLEVRGHWAQASLTRDDGSEVTIDGVTDTRITVAADVVPGVVTATVVGLVPTGRDGFDRDQLELAGAIASDLLPFRISHWGSGGGGGLFVTAVHSFGLTGVGVDVGVQRAGEFTVQEGAVGGYRPGDQFQIAAAVDRVVGSAGKMTLRLDGSFFRDGELDGVNVFRSGSRLGAVGSYSYPLGPASSGLFYAGYRHRSEGTFLLVDLDPAISLDPRPSQGTAVVGAAFRTPGLGGVLTPSLDLRALRRDDGVDQGWGVGIGSSGEWGSSAVTVIPGARVRFGSVGVREDVTSGFLGLDLSMQLRFGAGRQL